MKPHVHCCKVKVGHCPAWYSEQFFLVYVNAMSYEHLRWSLYGVMEHADSKNFIDFDI